MCGYCIETGALYDALENIKGNVRPTYVPILGMIHLQEASDWRKELEPWRSDDQAGGILVPLCRHWSERLAGKAPTALVDTLHADASAELQRWLATLDYSPEWQWALHTDGLLPSPPPIELARANLDSYISNWIQPPCSDDMSWDHKTLYEKFLGVSIAFDLVAQYAPDDARLTVLATKNPALTPFFNALDLWLQRRALRACTSHLGISFIRENFDELRTEAIVSVVLSESLSQDDLIELKTSIQDRTHPTMNFSIVDLLELLEIKIWTSPETGFRGRFSE